MATLHPFRALRPNAASASRIAAVPYDVVSTEEAAALADGNPLSFLRVSRAEIELPPGSDPYADAVYKKAARNFSELRHEAMIVEDLASVYLYRLEMGGHVQTGLAASRPPARRGGWEGMGRVFFSPGGRGGARRSRAGPPVSRARSPPPTSKKSRSPPAATRKTIAPGTCSRSARRPDRCS